jgi:general secretion pathway protein J
MDSLRGRPATRAITPGFARTPQPYFPQQGFTLIELLVVMTLLSVIMLGLVTALRNMAQTESKIDQRLERLDEIRVARTFLQQTLSRVSSSTLDAPGTSGKTIIPFAATSDSLTWVGILPPRPNLGGRHFFRLSMEDTPAGGELILRFAPWQPDLISPDWSQTEARILIRGISQMTVQTQGLPPRGHALAQSWPKGWQNGWPITDALPEQLRLGLTDTQGGWPEWNMALHALPQSDSSFSRVVVGGSR